MDYQTTAVRKLSNICFETFASRQLLCDIIYDEVHPLGSLADIFGPVKLTAFGRQVVGIHLHCAINVA